MYISSTVVILYEEILSPIPAADLPTETVFNVPGGLVGDFAARDSSFTMPDAGPGYTKSVGVGAMITRIGFHARCWVWFMKNSIFFR